MNRAACILILLLLTVAGAGAHPILQNPVFIEACPTGVKVRLFVSVRELIVVQRLPSATDGSFDLLQAEEYADRHKDYVLDHFQVKADRKLLSGKVVEIRAPGEDDIGDGLEAPDRAHFQYIIEYPLAAPPAVFAFNQTMCVEFPSSPGVPWDLSYAYRYGAPGETPKMFGSLTRDMERSINTGWGLVPLSVAFEAMPKTRAGLWLLFAVAMALGGGLRLIWYQTAALVWLISYIAAEHVAGVVPMTLINLAGGAAVIMAAVDNIYIPTNGAHAVRRIVLLMTGSVFFGLGLRHDEPSVPAEGGIWEQLHSSHGWPAVLFVVAVGLTVLVCWLVQLTGKRNERTKNLVTQLSSLVICGGGVALMLRLLHVF